MITPTTWTGLPQDGFIMGMPEDVYHASDAVSKTALDLIERSPAHYRYSPPKEKTRHMVMGSAIHCALLEPERFDRTYLCLTDAKDRRSAEWKAAEKAGHGPDIILTASEADRVHGMREAVYAQPAARAVLEAEGYRELSAFVADGETGLMIRARFDLLSCDGRAVDLKKTQDARERPFSRSVVNYRYHVQAAMYSDIYYQIVGEPLAAFGFLAVEEELPHAARFFVLDDEAMAAGHAAYRRNLETLARCMERDEWPAYGDDVIMLSLPPWAVE